MILSNNFIKKKAHDPRILDLINLYLGLLEKEHWCQRSIARDKEGNRLFNPFDENCWSYCILGYLHALEANNETFTFLDKMVKQFGYYDVDRFNDFSDHETVLKFIKRCVKGLGYQLDDKEIEKIMKEHNAIHPN